VIHACPYAERVDLRLDELTHVVEDEQGYELSSITTVNGWLERSRQEELPTIRRPPNMFRVIVVVIDGNESRPDMGHRQILAQVWRPSGHDVMANPAPARSWPKVEETTSR
jgi:hypothetical protein